MKLKKRFTRKTFSREDYITYEKHKNIKIFLQFEAEVEIGIRISFKHEMFNANYFVSCSQFLR